MDHIESPSIKDAVETPRQSCAHMPKTTISDMDLEVLTFDDSKLEMDKSCGDTASETDLEEIDSQGEDMDGGEYSKIVDHRDEGVESGEMERNPMEEFPMHFRNRASSVSRNAVSPHGWRLGGRHRLRAAQSCGRVLEHQLHMELVQEFFPRPVRDLTSPPPKAPNFDESDDEMF